MFTFAVELGLLKIFNHFIKVSDIVNSFPSIFKNIAEDLIDDIRGLIPEIESLSAKYNVTESLLTEIGSALNMSKVIDEIIPELEKVSPILQGPFVQKPVSLTLG